MPQPGTAAVEPSPSPQTDAKLLVITVPRGEVSVHSQIIICAVPEKPVTSRSMTSSTKCSSRGTRWGYRFNSWKQSSEHFCGGQVVKCTIITGSADSATRLEPIFDRDVASTGYEGIRKLDYSDMAVDDLFFNQVHADFDSDGVLDLFRVAGHASGLSAERYHLELWLGNGDGTYRRDDGRLVEPTVGGINPRKVVAADFNGDDKTDVIVADHGYDAWPFPGAPLLLYLSTADGRLEKAERIGVHHRVPSLRGRRGHRRGWGHDAFVTDWWPAFLINDGKGT